MMIGFWNKQGEGKDRYVCRYEQDTGGNMQGGNETDQYGYRYDQNSGGSAQSGNGNDEYSDRHRQNYDFRQDYNNNVKSAALASTSLTIAIIGLISGFIMLIILPMILSGVALVLALISRSDKKRFHRPARVAIILSTITLAVNTGLLGAGVHTIYLFNTDPAYHEEVNNSMRDLTGYSLDDYLQIISGEAPSDDQNGQSEQSGQSEEPESGNDDSGSEDSDLPDGVQELPYLENAGEVTL